MRPGRISGEAGFEEVTPLTRIARITRIVGYASLFAFILVVFVVAFLRAWSDPWAIIAFVVVGLGMIAGVVFNFEGVAEVVISQKTAIGANSALMVALAFALLVMINYLSARHWAHRFDLTSARSFTLDDRTKKLLGKLDSELEVATFMAPSRYGPSLMVPVSNLLEQYEVECEHIKITYGEFHDPQQPVKLAERLGFTRDALEQDCILMAYKGNTKKLKRSDLVDEMPYSPYGPRPQPTLKIEDAISSAIRELMKQEAPVLYYVVGHGEQPMTHEQRGQGLSLAKADLKGQNYDIREIKLAETKEIPDDAAVVLIVGPRKSFTPEEEEALSRHLARGGGAVILLDSILGARGFGPCGLAGLLEERGIKVRQDVRVMQVSGGIPGVFTLLGETVPAGSYSATHPVTKPLNDARIASYFAGACSLEKCSPEDPALEVEELVKTVPQAWGETSASGEDSQRPNLNGGGDVKGPVVVAIASGPREGEKGGKLVVFADVDFALDYMYTKLANGDLLINAVNWIVGVEENIGIESRAPDVRTANMTDKNKSRVRLVNVVLVPLLILACGAAVLWLRRK